MSWVWRITWSQIFIAIGLSAMILGAVDPLEGWPVIAGGTAAVAIGAALERSRHRAIIFASAGLVAIGVAAMIVLSQVGGIGGNSGHSLWWGITCLPYPIGWMIGLIAGVLAFIETIQRSRAQWPDV